jgi:maltose/moltooligosaccharide transporter
MPPIFFGACMLLFMDSAFNVAMQPFRALVGDMVNDKQRNLGYSLQSWLINIGAVIGSFLPIILTWLGIRNVPEEGKRVAPSVVWSFYIGGTILLLTILWTCFRVKEYPPKEFNEYNNIDAKNPPKQSFLSIVANTPKTMLQLGLVQFFSWFALFIMWVYTTHAIAKNIWHTTDVQSHAFNEAGDWNGVLQGVYGIFAILFSIVMPKIADKFGRKPTYSFALLMGAIGLISIFFIQDKYVLFLSMLGIGIAWAGILAMPYTILSAALPPAKMGVYMGLFNATITLPQIAAGVLGKPLYDLFAQNNSAIMLVVAGISMLLAAVSVFGVQSKQVKNS